MSLVSLHELTATLTPITFGWLDNSALSWIYARRTPLLDGVFIAATWAGSVFVLLPTCVVLMANLAIRGRQLEVWLLGLGMIGAMLMSQIAKAIFSRPRPELFDPLVAMPTSWSFPSGHSTQIVAFALCMALIAYRYPSSTLRRLIMAGGILMVISVAFSRIYLQVHYPSDVLAGGMLALLWVAGLYTLLKWLASITPSQPSLP